MRKLDCEETQNLLDAFADNALDGVTSLAVQEHLDTCSSCRSHWEWNQELTGSLKRLKEATPCVDARLRLSALSSPGFKLPGLWFTTGLRRYVAAMAILLVGLLSGASWLLWQTPATPAAMHFVRDHGASHQADHGNRLVTTDPVQAISWLTERLNADYVIPAQALEGFELEGVRICHMGSAPVAHVMYEKEGRRISFYLTEQSLASLRGLDHAKERGYGSVKTGECEGKPLAIWSREKRSYILVGDVPPNDLLALANQFSAQL